MYLYIRFNVFVFFFCTFLLYKNFSYAISDSEIYQSNRCLEIIKRAEDHFNIPKGILWAIAYHESKKKHSYHKGLLIVWPWTVSINGKGYHFSNKKQAVKFTESLVNKGVKNIDIGCMQINLKYHSKAFKSISHAFTPYDNINYGAQFLVQKYKQSGSWKKAIGHYHSTDNNKASNYLKKVYQVHQLVYPNKGLGIK